MNAKQRALNMHKTDNRLDVVRRHKKVAHLPAMDMEKRRAMRGEKSTNERLHDHE